VGVRSRGMKRRVGAPKLPRTPTTVFNPALPARHAPTGDREKLGHDSVFNVFITPDQSVVESEENKDLILHHIVMMEDSFVYMTAGAAAVILVRRRRRRREQSEQHQRDAWS